MQIFKISSLVPLLLAASAFAAPQPAVRSGIADHEDHMPNKRDLSARKSEEDDLEKDVDNLIKNHPRPLRHIMDKATQFGCNTHQKKVHPIWLWNQVENKIDYLTQPGVEAFSNHFAGSHKGLDWVARQDGEDNTKLGDWVEISITWHQITGGTSNMTPSLAKAVARNGIDTCSYTQSGFGRRCQGFGALYNDEWAMHLMIRDIDDDQTSKSYPKHEYIAGGDVWQTPYGVKDEDWTEFIKQWEKVGNKTALE